jgi:hypothetical protein
MRRGIAKSTWCWCGGYFSRRLQIGRTSGAPHSGMTPQQTGPPIPYAGLPKDTPQLQGSI